MYTQVWNKYLPIIRILAKRSATSEQTLAMNATDFQRAGAGRKVSYKFTMRFSNGRLQDNIGPSPVAKDLLPVLVQDDVLKLLFRQNDYHVEMKSNFQLVITCIPKEVLEEVHSNTESEVQAVN